MADTKISALPAVSSAAGSNELAVNEGGTSKKATLTQLLSVVHGVEAADVVVDPSVYAASNAQAAFEALAIALDLLVAFVIPQGVEVDLTTEQVATLFSDPSEIVPAPGAGKVIVPIAGMFQYLAGTEPFASQPGLLLRPLAADEQLLSFSAELHTTVSAVALGGNPGKADTAVYENQPLVLTADTDPGFAGPILTSSLAVGGADYAEDDTFELQNALTGAVLAEGIVDTVDAGAILTYHLTSAGTRYGVNPNALLAATSGIGVSGELSIDSIDPQSDGSGRVRVWYYIVDLAS